MGHAIVKMMTSMGHLVWLRSLERIKRCLKGAA